MRHLSELDSTSEYVLGLEELADRLDGLTYAEIPEGTLNRGHFSLLPLSAPFRPLFSLAAQEGVHDYAAADATYVSWSSTDGRRTVGDPVSGPSNPAEVEFTDAIPFPTSATTPWVWLMANVNVESVTNRKIVGLSSPTFVAISIEALVAGSGLGPFSWVTIGLSERWMHPESVVLGANFNDTHFDVPISILWRPTSAPSPHVKGFRLRISIVEPNTSPATVVRLNRWSFSGMTVRRGSI